MSELDRRRFIESVSLANLAGLAGMAGLGAAAGAEQSDRGAPAEAPADVTRTLARYAVRSTYEELPAAIRNEACRTLLNWIGCAVGGSRHETVDAAIAALGPFSGPAQASVLGRKERFDILHAALMNGISSHVFDFDDTHLKTVMHPERAGGVGAARACGTRAGLAERSSCTRSCSASKSNAASGTRSTRSTTTWAGTSPARPACSARPQRPEACSGSTSSR